MKNLLKTHNPFRATLLIAIMFIASSSSGQKIKPSNSGYAPVNGIKVILRSIWGRKACHSITWGILYD